MTLIIDVIPKLRARKKLLGKCLKGSVSVDPSIDNIINGLKKCCNLNDKTFTILINHSEGNSVEKRIF